MLALNEARHWPNVLGRILESVPCPDPSGKHTHFRARYDFTAGDRPAGCRPRLPGDWPWSHEARADFLAR